MGRGKIILLLIMVSLNEDFYWLFFKVNFLESFVFEYIIWCLEILNDFIVGYLKRVF